MIGLMEQPEDFMKEEANLEKPEAWTRARNREEREQPVKGTDAEVSGRKRLMRSICELLRISGEREEFLMGVSAEEMPVWFRAVYEGLPIQELRNMQQNQWSKGEITARILQYMKKQLWESDAMTGQVEELKRQTQEALADYRYLRDTYVQELSESRKQEREAQQKAVEAKEETIRIQKEKITGLEEQIRILKRGRKQAVQTEPEKGKPKQTLFQKKSEIEQFRERYLGDADYSREQQEFLLGCFEEGLKFSEIQRFASPTLTVEQMGRLKKIYEKRYRKS